MAESLDKNIVDKDEYPQTAELEARCVDMLADLWHAPDVDAAVGTSTTGSSEAAMLGGLAVKFRWRQRRRAEGGDMSTPNIVCGPVQVCWEKFARYFDVEIRQMPMEGDRLALTPEEAVTRCDENTIAVVVTFGQTFTGLYEDVAAVSAALDRLQSDTGLDIGIHVDAASGGLPRVLSINGSGHKMGLAPLGCGWVVVTQYYTFARLGREGYRRVHAAAYETSQHLAREIAAMGPFTLVFDGDPRRGITAVAWRLNPTGAQPFSLFEVAELLLTRGWLVPAYTLPAHLEHLAIQRVIVRHGFSRAMADLLLDDLRRTVAALRERPATSSPPPGLRSSFSHDAVPATP